MRAANENCPHTTRPDAGACSQCMPGVRVRRIGLDGNWLALDGKRVRAVAEPQAPYARLGTGKRRAAAP